MGAFCSRGEQNRLRISDSRRSHRSNHATDSLACIVLFVVDSMREHEHLGHVFLSDLLLGHHSRDRLILTGFSVVNDISPAWANLACSLDNP